jgi:hypothetical protein
MHTDQFVNRHNGPRKHEIDAMLKTINASSVDELINQTKDTIDKIYVFCGWEPFEHDFTNIVVKYPEDDSVYGLKGQHEIRPTIKKNENPIQLSEEILEKCANIEKVIDTFTVMTNV